jgi:hypothetical protein
MPRTSPEEQERARQEWAEREAAIPVPRPLDESGRPSTASGVFVDRAREAAARGERFFEAQIPMSTLTGTASFGTAESTAAGYPREPDLLGRIEDAGWHLEKADYVFVPMYTESSSRPFHSGDRTATSGFITGVYLFRRAGGR